MGGAGWAAGDGGGADGDGDAGGADGDAGGVGEGTADGDGDELDEGEGEGDPDGLADGEADGVVVGEAAGGVALQPPARKMYCVFCPLQPRVIPAGCEYQSCMLAGSALTKRFITVFPTCSP